MIAAVIILYYPDLAELAGQLASLSGQVDTVFAIDNTPSSKQSSPPPLEGFGYPAFYIALDRNQGIATAQNRGLELCVSKGFSHILLLDQDSILMPNCVERLLKAETHLTKTGHKVAAVCPKIDDARTGNRPLAVRYRWGFVEKIWVAGRESCPILTDSMIASGSLIRTEALQAVGFMSDDLFIEYVDTEWAFRARAMGFENFCVPDAILMHHLGDNVVQVLGKNVHLYSAIRYQYKLRNATYLLRLKTMGWSWRCYAVFIIGYHLFLFTFVSKNRLQMFRSLLGAMHDGWKARLGEISPK